MSTNRIGIGATADLMRALAAMGRGTGVRSPSASGSPPSANAPSDAATLRKRLADLVCGVDLEDEQAVKGLRRPVLTEILLWEFGAAFRGHSEFPSMLESIERAFDSDPATHDRFAALLRALHSFP